MNICDGLGSGALLAGGVVTGWLGDCFSKSGLSVSCPFFSLSGEFGCSITTDCSGIGEVTLGFSTVGGAVVFASGSLTPSTAVNSVAGGAYRPCKKRNTEIKQRWLSSAQDFGCEF